MPYTVTDLFRAPSHTAFSFSILYFLFPLPYFTALITAPLSQLPPPPLLTLSPPLTRVHHAPALAYLWYLLP